MTNATMRAIDRAADRLGGVSDYRLAQVLGVRQQTLSKYRTGVSQLDDAIAVKVAELAGIKPAQLLAEIQAERTKDEAARAHWQRLAALARAACFVAAIFAALVVEDHRAVAGWNPHGVEVSAALPHSEAVGSVEYYVNHHGLTVRAHSAAPSVPPVTVDCWTFVVLASLALALFLRCLKRGPTTKRGN